jgi:hydrophobe/amphiphile efflux-3 (HAE3) family protein
MRDLFARITAWCVERPPPVLAATALLVCVGAVGALRLEADAGTDQLVDTDSAAYQATEEFHQDFGDDAVAVLVDGDLEQLMLTETLTDKLLPLEACLSGNAPGGAVFRKKPAPQPCAELAEAKPAQVVFGPATFLNQSAIQASEVFGQQQEAAMQQAQEAGAAAAEQARSEGATTEQQQAIGQAAAQQVLGGFINQYYELAARYGGAANPQLSNPAFIRQVVFDSENFGQPKSKWSFLFPSGDAAMITVRLKPDLTEGERSEAIQLIRDAVGDDAFRIRDATYVVGGVPVVIDDLTDTLSSEIYLLLGIVLAVMAVALLLFVGPPLRLLPLGIALGAAALTFGLLAAFGGALTLASLAVLPVLIGLSVDYAIQFQARFGELRRGGASPARASVEAAATSGPVIGAAALATGAGFLVLLLWPLPVIRTFGLLLLAGIGFAFVLTLTAGLTVLSFSKATERVRDSRARSFPGATALQRIATAWGAAGARLRSIGRRTVAFSMAHAGRLLVVSILIAGAGWIGGIGTDVNADIREQLPSAVEGIDEIEEGTGVSGEVPVVVEGDLQDPAVINWMASYKQRVLDRAGFNPEELCIDQEAALCPSIALSDVVAGDDGKAPSAARLRDILSLLPTYFTQAVATVDPETGAPGDTAVISFGIKAIPFDEQKELIDGMRSELDPPGAENDPPEGVEASVVGLPALISDASASLTRDRYLLTVGGLLAVALALLAVYRSAQRALIPLIPIFLATGWSAAAVWALGIELNPMSATLGALVIAIATEFSVLLAARFEEERARGVALGEALRGAYSTTGTAVLASGITATAGFAVLIASGIPLLRNFGIVTVLDLGVALLAVLVVLPAALVWAAGGFEPVRGVVGRRRERASAATTP